MKEPQAVAILADPFAEEDRWLAASKYVTRKFQPLLVRSADNDLTDVACGSIGGLIFTFATANLLAQQCYSIFTFAILLLANTGLIYLASTRNQQRSKLLVVATLAISVSLFITAFISFLFPPGWKF